MRFFTPQEWISLRGVGFTERSVFLHSPGVDFIDFTERSGFSTSQESDFIEGVREEFLHSPERGSGFLHSPGFH